VVFQLFLGEATAEMLVVDPGGLVPTRLSREQLRQFLAQEPGPGRRLKIGLPAQIAPEIVTSLRSASSAQADIRIAYLFLAAVDDSDPFLAVGLVLDEGANERRAADAIGEAIQAHLADDEHVTVFVLDEELHALVADAVPPVYER
jgi:hypothetical protein